MLALVQSWSRQIGSINHLQESKRETEERGREQEREKEGI